MVINYIYLILILILITSIYYFIYLSYEYRGMEIDNSNNLDILSDTDNDYNRLPLNNAQIENFDLQVNMPNNNTINNNLNMQLRNNVALQQQYLNTAYNNKIETDNKDYNNINKKLSINASSSNTLLKKHQSFEPIPKSFPIDKLINTIKSNYNSQYLSLITNDINKYGVLINDKCFTVNGLCKDEFCTTKCQNSLYTSDSQKFYTDRITSSDDIIRLMKIPKNNINSKNVYPFNIFRSKVNDKCLSINNVGLGIEDCNLNSLQQQWSISPNENICVLK